MKSDEGPGKACTGAKPLHYAPSRMGLSPPHLGRQIGRGKEHRTIKIKIGNTGTWERGSNAAGKEGAAARRSARQDEAAGSGTGWGSGTGQGSGLGRDPGWRRARPTSSG